MPRATENYCSHGNGLLYCDRGGCPNFGTERMRHQKQGMEAMRKACLDLCDALLMVGERIEEEDKALKLLRTTIEQVNVSGLFVELGAL